MRNRLKCKSVIISKSTSINFHPLFNLREANSKPLTTTIAIVNMVFDSHLLGEASTFTVLRDCILPNVDLYDKNKVLLFNPTDIQ